MSISDLTMAPRPVERPTAPARRAGVPWARVALACAVLGAAGGARWWQQWRVQAAIARTRAEPPPFPLGGVPMRLGPWQAPESERHRAMDPKVVEILGCTDHIARQYVDERTGVRIDAIVLYGPGTIAHSPEVCYPGSGYAMIEGPTPRTVATAVGPVPFHALVFAKGEGAAADRQQVYYTWRYDGRWSADFDLKDYTRIPAMYKVQLTRQVAGRERLYVGAPGEPGNPCEAFLQALLPELERRIAGARPPSQAVASDE